MIRVAGILAIAVLLSGCVAPGAIGWQESEDLAGGGRVSRTVAIGIFTNGHGATLGAVSDVTVTFEPGACAAVFVTKPTFTIEEVRQHLAPLVPERFCPERIEPND